MVSLLYDIAVFHEQDVVGVAYRGKSVRDNEARSSVHELFHCLADLLFRARIDAGGGFVEDQYRRIAEEYSGDSQKLLLSARKV